MTSSVASESTPMSRPLGLTRNKLITPDKTACPPTRQAPQRYPPGHPGQELTSPPTARCRADIPGSQLGEKRHVRELGWDRGLTFGLIRLRSPTFIGIQINADMQVADVNSIRRTIVQTSENRKDGDPTSLLTDRSVCYFCGAARRLLRMPTSAQAPHQWVGIGQQV
jgi:hypothetical protein